MDDIIESALENIREGKHLPESKITAILFKLSEILQEEENILEIESPIVICGDIHGQLFDLFEMFDQTSKQGLNGKFLFLGDYVDRGHFSIETFLYLAIQKIKAPERFFLLRGNHEDPSVNYMYGLYHDSVNLYGSAGLFRELNSVFNLLPLVAIIDGAQFCVHGGLSPQLNNIEELGKIRRGAVDGVVSDLLWSDPGDSPGWAPSSRGAGILFGEKVTRVFLQQNGLDRVVRSHQVIMDGFEERFGGLLVTVWSAPNYMYRVGNKACVLAADGPLPDRLIFFEPREERQYTDISNPWPYFM